jgi:hypothetical protein
MEAGDFESRLRALVPAAWWTFVVGIVWTTLGWAWWLVILGSPALTGLVEKVWGGVTVAEARPTVWLVFGVMKLVLFGWFLLAICVTLWSRKLRKA